MMVALCWKRREEERGAGAARSEKVDKIVLSLRGGNSVGIESPYCYYFASGFECLTPLVSSSPPMHALLLSFM